MSSHKPKGIVTKRSDPPLASQSNQVGVVLEGPTPARMPRSLAMARLLERDPLFRELIDHISEIRGTPKEMEAQLDSTMKAHRETLHKKYPAIRLIFLDQSNLIFLEQSNENQGKFVVALENERRGGTLRYTVNFITLASGSTETTLEEAVHPWQFPGPMNANAPPSIFFQIDLSKVTLWDLQRLARDFKRILRKFLRGSYKPPRGWPASEPEELAFLSPVGSSVFFQIDLSRVTLWDLERLARDFKMNLRKSLGGSHKPLRGWPASEPEELAFLRTVRPDVFYRDLQRYDLHIKHGLSYRLIALLEVEGKASNLDQIPQQRLVRKKIPPESGVGDSVPRIYQAIYRKKYNAKRRRLDTPAVGIEPYHCPTHGQDCSLSCPVLIKFRSKVYPTLPTDQTGR